MLSFLSNTAYAQTLKIPGLDQIKGPLTNTNRPFDTPGGVITTGLDIFFTVMTFIAFLWMIWGAIAYIFAAGEKEALSKAKNRIFAALIGLFIIALSYTATQLIFQILQPNVPNPLSLSIIQPVYAQASTGYGSDLSKTYAFGNFLDFGSITALIMPFIFSIATTGVVIYFLIGAFRFVISAGNKESISKAQSMITHAVIGFFILIFIFLIFQFIPQFFGFKFSVFGQ